MGGRGATSGNVATYNTKLTKPTLSTTPLKKMSNSMLKNELLKMATYYYKSGKSGISFGKTDPEEAAKKLISQKRSRASMEKDYKSILKRIK